MTVLAWSGELLLLEARWTDKDAHTAKFRLVTPNEARPNPFKQFTKRRSGRAGTRFVMSLAHIGELTTQKTAYDGEVMLAGWADTSTQGYTVTFWLEPPEEGTHQLEGYQRGVSSFMCALVELDDDDHPVNQEKRTRVETAIRKQAEPTVDKGGESAGSAPAADDYQAGWDDPRKDAVVTPEMKGVPPEHHGEPVVGTQPRGPRKLSQYAAMLCTNKDFWEWCGVGSTEDATAWMRAELGIESRRELDDGGYPAQDYHDKIRRPFVAWSEEREHS